MNTKGGEFLLRTSSKEDEGEARAALRCRLKGKALRSGLPREEDGMDGGERRVNEKRRAVSFRCSAWTPEEAQTHCRSREAMLVTCNSVKAAASKNRNVMTSAVPIRPMAFCNCTVKSVSVLHMYQDCFSPGKD